MPCRRAGRPGARARFAVPQHRPAEPANRVPATARWPPAPALFRPWRSGPAFSRPIGGPAVDWPAALPEVPGRESQLSHETWKPYDALLYPTRSPPATNSVDNLHCHSPHVNSVLTCWFATLGNIFRVFPRTVPWRAKPGRSRDERSESDEATEEPQKRPLRGRRACGRIIHQETRLRGSYGARAPPGEQSISGPERRITTSWQANWVASLRVRLKDLPSVPHCFRIGTVANSRMASSTSGEMVVWHTLQAPARNPERLHLVSCTEPTRRRLCPL